MTKYQSPFNLPDEHMRLVGLIAAHWEYVDFFMNTIVAWITKHPQEKVYLFTSNLSFRTKMDLLKAYTSPIKSYDKKTWKEAEEIYNSLEKANNLRNDYVHATWSIVEGDNIPRRFVVRLKNGKLIHSYSNVPVSELEKATVYIHDTGVAMCNFFQKRGYSAPEEKGDLNTLLQNYDND